MRNADAPLVEISHDEKMKVEEYEDGKNDIGTNVKPFPSTKSEKI